jgi:hypothetical protein
MMPAVNGAPSRKIHCVPCLEMCLSQIHHTTAGFLRGIVRVQYSSFRCFSASASQEDPQADGVTCYAKFYCLLNMTESPSHCVDSNLPATEYHGVLGSDSFYSNDRATSAVSSMAIPCSATESLAEVEWSSGPWWVVWEPHALGFEVRVKRSCGIIDANERYRLVLLETAPSSHREPTRNS